MRLYPITSMPRDDDGRPAPWPMTHVRVLANISDAWLVGVSHIFPQPVRCLCLEDTSALYAEPVRHRLWSLADAGSQVARPLYADASCTVYLRCPASQYEVDLTNRPNRSAPFADPRSSDVTLRWDDGLVLGIRLLDPQQPLVSADVPRTEVRPIFDPLVRRFAATGRVTNVSRSRPDATLLQRLTGRGRTVADVRSPQAPATLSQLTRDAIYSSDVRPRRRS